MKMNLRTLTLVVLLGVSLMLSACGGGGGTSSSSGGASSGGSAAAGPVTLDLGSDGENLAFDKTELSVSAGQQVTVNFKNNSAAQQHNWVLIKGGDAEAKVVADAGLTAGADKDYLPADTTNILAHTKLSNGGETVSVTFTAPAAGTYQYICTAPGHYPLMVGTLTVK